MAESRYFVYQGSASYSKIADDGSAVYQFRPGSPVEVKNFNDQMKFAGNPDFIETDKKGKPVENSELPTNNGPAGAISYVTMGGEKPAPAATPPEPKAEEKPAEPKKKTSSAKKKSAKKSAGK